MRVRRNLFCKYTSESSYHTTRQVRFELKSHNLLSLSIWFHTDPCPKAVYDSCLTGLARIRESPSGYKGKFIEWRAGEGSREHINELFEILSPPSFSFPRHPPGVAPSSLSHSQPNVVKSLHFLTCHSGFHSLHPDCPSISPPTTPSVSPRTAVSRRGHVSALILFALLAMFFH